MNAEYFSERVLQASLLIPFMLEDADDDWDEVMEAMQAKEWELKKVAPPQDR